MQHDPDLLEALAAFKPVPFDGVVFRATRQNLSPVAASTNGGRWMVPRAAPVLYTSQQREGSLAEISFHYARMTPVPTKPVTVHRLQVSSRRTLKLIQADIASLGVPREQYKEVGLLRTQQIGAAVEYLGCDGLIAPSARWSCDNLILFPERLAIDCELEILESEEVEWLAWAKANGLYDHEEM
ncbi:MAG: RES family NAD+ phosphorylase [Burkholderiales bacterium]|uniref:RES family NAD+ phosphorylase n=1 Tax=Ottowia pentelensis TaxID=511108 RepID=A0ABV6PWI6_9BURK|nr:RES family NAD+ phosphorylase [Ottowia sp.]MBN9404730.1 RES family NAD+ phosphorylase [Burkholderiales bacterium]MBS0403767.1 RES family NAD+ phosphorylase [Pseudomonadota bacterium]MBS0414078.1 RES family NAD+ phosphorylase [Pseudomonadota bacterium]MBS1941823.1 RES family NAD+ phosphorylase [Bacteroidota bacterium]